MRKLSIAKMRRYAKAVKACIKAIDAQMKLPSTHERGRQIAKILNALEFQTDCVLRFDLAPTQAKEEKR